MLYLYLSNPSSLTPKESPNNSYPPHTNNYTSNSFNWATDASDFPVNGI